MKITMTLNVPNIEDIDPADPTGLTEAAYTRLSDAIVDAGFEFVDGPDGVADEAAS